MGLPASCENPPKQNFHRQMIAALLSLLALALLLRLAWPHLRPTNARRLRRALEKKHKGDPAPLRRLADEGLGDAILEQFRDLDAAGDASAALAELKRATGARIWVDHSHGAWREYDRRRFLGIGAAPDYGALLAEWSAGLDPGHGRELELAWIQACGPESLRDLARAWSWLCLAQARWGENPRALALPADQAAHVRQLLLQRLPEPQRDHAMEEARRVAHQEFVAGK